MIVKGPGDTLEPWIVANEIVGALDVTEGGGRAYSLREKKEAHKVVRARGIRGTQREMVDAFIDGLLTGHSRGLAAGQKHTTDKMKESMRQKTT